MTKPPKMTIQGWTENGPAYTIHRSLAGRRNARRRRQGETGNELVGPHDLLETAPFGDGPASSLMWAIDSDESWGFKAGYVYAATILVDGDATQVLLDAREGDLIEHWGDGLQLLEARVLEEDEIERAMNGGAEQPSNISDGAESQEPVDDDEESTGDDDYPESIPVFRENADTLDLADIMHYAENDSRKGIREAAAAELERRQEVTSLTGAQTEELTDAQVDELDFAEDEAAEDSRDETAETAETAARLEAALTPGTPEHAQVVESIGKIANEIAGEPTGSADGRWEELEAKFAADQITDEELAELAEYHEQANSSLEDDEDAVGGDGDSASNEEE